MREHCGQMLSPRRSDALLPSSVSHQVHTADEQWRLQNWTMHVHSKITTFFKPLELMNAYRRTTLPAPVKQSTMSFRFKVKGVICICVWGASKYYLYFL